MSDKPNVGSIPSMVPDRDDIRERHTPPPSPPPKEPVDDIPFDDDYLPSKTPWGLVASVVVLAIAAIFMAYQQYSLHQLQASYEERLELADDRIVSLERALNQTDESVALNETAINAQFKAIKADTDVHMSEIRKLWDVANKRNKNWIEENQAALKSQLASVNAAEKSIDELADQLNSSDQAVSSLKGQLSPLQQLTQSNKQELASMTQQLNSLSDKLEGALQANIEERLISLTLTQEDLLAEQASYSRQLQAIDASRLETSKRLTALASQLDALSARLDALAN
ncbi:hypothetical protein [Reinekea thalattae]|uniref:Uncharacterized protein n=1 Tax=Reinekea thalattae TaxID=2593301 RepID=A0A5C8Z8D7_9GAMM|nr:hypothetical protein [Reinekea thalattae]TXR53927.1 hypothetical protein FME95_05080 [Reinekea thalattae]